MSFTERTAQQLIASDLLSITAPSVAEKLGISSSWLRENLAKEGTSFLILLHRERKRRAVLYVACTPEASLAQVSRAIGYKDKAHTSHFFRKCFDTTFEEYRSALL